MTKLGWPAPLGACTTSQEAHDEVTKVFGGEMSDDHGEHEITAAEFTRNPSGTLRAARGGERVVIVARGEQVATLAAEVTEEQALRTLARRGLITLVERPRGKAPEKVPARERLPLQVLLDPE